MEALEDRLAPANTLYWSGGGLTSNMSEAANYVGGVAPVAGDMIYLDGAQGPNPNKAATADAGLPASLGGIQMQTGYGGSLTVARDLTATFLGTAGQTVTVNAGSTLSGQMLFVNGGTLTGAGTFAVGSDDAPGGLTIGLPTTVSISSLTVTAGSMLTISADTTLDGTTVTNLGSIDWNAGNISPINATVTNTGTFTISAAGQTFGNGAAVENDGRMVADVGAGNTCTIRSGVDNEAGAPTPFEVESGTLSLTAPGTSTAEMTTDNGATLDLAAVFGYTAANGAKFDGPGTLQVSGQLIAAANLVQEIDNPVRLLGTLNGPGDFNLTSGLLAAGGSITGTAVTVRATVEFNAAPPSSALSLSSSGLFMQGGGLWTSGDIDLTNSTVQNAGTFAIQCGGLMSNVQNSTFENQGTATLNKAAGTALTTFATAVTNAGTWRLNGTTIQFNQGLTQSGGLIDLSGGTLDLMKLGVPQTAQLNGGKLVGNGTVTGKLINAAGTVEVTGTLSVGGNYVQQVDATLQIDATSDSDWGQLQVGGNASLSGTLSLNLDYVPDGEPNAIVTTAGTVDGTFNDLPGWVALYLGSSVVLRTE